jgi:hypothetical protein
MKNTFRHNDDDTTTIIIKRHGFKFNVLIDTVDFERANEFAYSWRLKWDKVAKTYFVMGTTGKIPRKTYSLVRWIIGLDDESREIHHINHNGRDCRRCNVVIKDIDNRKRVQRNRRDRVGDANGVDGFVFGPVKRKDGSATIEWGRSYVNDLMLDTHPDYSDSLTERRLAMELVAGNTDERIVAQLTVLGHDPVVIMSELTRLRKLYVWPNTVTTTTSP